MKITGKRREIKKTQARRLGKIDYPPVLDRPKE